VSTPTSVAAHPRDQISVDERRSEVIGVVHAFCVASMNEIEAIELRTFFLWPLAITAIVAPITCFVGRFWSGCLWSVIFACSVTTLAAFGLWLSSDLAWAKLMWLPGVFAQNASVAFPVSMLLGLPYVLLRRRNRHERPTNHTTSTPSSDR